LDNDQLNHIRVIPEALAFYSPIRLSARFCRV